MTRLLLRIATLLCIVTAAAEPVVTVLSTDIGGDIDDTWALAHILRSKELDLRMVLTERGDPTYRGRLTAKLLERTGRTDVVVALGIEHGDPANKRHFQGPWVKNYDLDAYPGTVHADGVQAFIDFVNASPGPIKVIAIGPPPSLAEAVRRDPGIAAKCDLYGMYGSFEIGYGGAPTPSAESNVRVDPTAVRAVLAAPWRSITITPLDTCGLVDLAGANYHAVWSATGDPLLRSVIENYCIWAPLVTWLHCDYFATRSSTLFDDVAVYLAYDGSLLNFETITFDVTDDGFTRRNPAGPFRARVAISWRDLEGFKRGLSARLTGRAPAD